MFTPQPNISRAMHHGTAVAKIAITYKVCTFWTLFCNWLHNRRRRVQPVVQRSRATVARKVHVAAVLNLFQVHTRLLKCTIPLLQHVSLTDFATVTSACKPWCLGHDKPWQDKCTWMGTCDACEECSGALLSPCGVNYGDFTTPRVTLGVGERLWEPATKKINLK